jgi:hypothetical protein
MVYPLMHGARLASQIELKNAGNHDDGLGLMSVLEHREPERFRPVDEQAAAKVLLVLNDPVSAAVLTNKEDVRSLARCRRGRFQLAHDTSPCGLERRRPVAGSAISSMVEVRNPDRDIWYDNPA